MDDDGFYMGELNGVRGLVPSNFLTEAPGQNQGQPPLGRRPGGQSQGPGARGPPPPPREPPPAGHRRGKGKQHPSSYRFFLAVPGHGSSSSSQTTSKSIMLCLARRKRDCFLQFKKNFFSYYKQRRLNLLRKRMRNCSTRFFFLFYNNASGINDDNKILFLRVHIGIVSTFPITDMCLDVAFAAQFKNQIFRN